MREVNLETITDTRSWFKILPLKGSEQTYPCKTKTSQETQRSLQKFLKPDRKPKVIYTDNSLESGKISWVSIMESSNLNTSSIRDKWHCWKSRKTSERRYLSSVATIAIGWNVNIYLQYRKMATRNDWIMDTRNEWPMRNQRDELQHHNK